MLPLGEQPMNIHPPELFTGECALLCHLSAVVQAHKVHCCWPLPSGLLQLWECWQLALVSLRHCFHKATSAEPLKSCPKTAVVSYLDPLWELWRKLRPWPIPAHMCTHPQNPQLPRPSPSQPQEHPLSAWMSCRC